MAPLLGKEDRGSCLVPTQSRHRRRTASDHVLTAPLCALRGDTCDTELMLSTTLPPSHHPCPILSHLILSLLSYLNPSNPFILSHLIPPYPIPLHSIPPHYIHSILFHFIPSYLYHSPHLTPSHPLQSYPELVTMTQSRRPQHCLLPAYHCSNTCCDIRATLSLRACQDVSHGTQPPFGSPPFGGEEQTKQGQAQGTCIHRQP